MHRTVKEIVDFISVNFYNDTLEATRLYVDCGDMENYYPIQFVEIEENAIEVSVTLKKNFINAFTVRIYN